MDYSVAREALLQRPDLDSGGTVRDADIQQAERSVGPFPSDYRAFLAEFGWVTFGPVEVFGLGPTIPCHLDVVTASLDERDLGLPPHLIALMNDGGGNLFCVPRADLAAECGAFVRLWAHDEGRAQTATPVATSFSAWIHSSATST